MTRPTAALIALAGLPAAAGAQIVTTQSSTVSYSLTWQESDPNGLPAGNGNGTLDPGEHALLRLTVSFSNQFTVGTYTPFPPGPGSGTIRGFGMGFIDLNGTNGTAGNWDVDPNNGHGIDGAWDLVGPTAYGLGGPVAGHSGGNLINIQAGQFAQFIVTTNPIPDIWRGLWTPDSFHNRIVTFTTAAGSSSGGAQFASVVLFRLASSGFPNMIAAYCPSDFGSVHIPIAPAPSPALLLAPLLFRRRKRPAPERTMP